VYKDVAFGLVTYSDKPVSPYGSNSSREFQLAEELAYSCYSVLISLQSSLTVSGGDSASSSLSALFYSAVNASELGFRDASVRVLVLITSNAYHQAGDYSTASSNNLDNKIQVSEDYVSVSETRNALEAAGNDISDSRGLPSLTRLKESHLSSSYLLRSCLHMK
jgi:hypothetical protein